MDETQHRKLRRLLERLGRAVHRSIEDSDDVNHCLAELRAEGWQPVAFLEAAVARRNDDGVEPDELALRIRVGPATPEAEYLLDADDARWLAAIGISPSRHRSHPQRALPPLYRALPPACDDR